MIDVQSQRQLWLDFEANALVADSLDETAGLLQSQGANPFRVRAYRQGAQTIRGLLGPVEDLLAEEGTAGLTGLPGIGPSLARAIEQIIHTGSLPLLERLRGDAAPERVFTTVADIGPKLAARIHEHLGIESLAELLAACWDGRLATVPGMGKKRLLAVRESLAGRFQKEKPTSLQAIAPSPDEELPVGELLDVDDEYRRKAGQDRLPRIAPRRFNPERQAWLPILHTQRGAHHYTALYSNSARAHELGTTRDWVIIYRDDEQHNGQWTVITSQLGQLKGHRIVRGREDECAQWYANG